MGYDKDQLANVYLYGEMEKQFDLIKKDLLETGAALSVAKVQAPMNSNWSSSLDLSWEGKDPTSQTQINQYSEAGGFVQTAGLQLIQGRDIDIKAYPADSTACVVNESALRLMNFKNPIGELIYDGPISWHVVGVIKDYIQESPYQSIKPMIIKGPKDWMGVILIRLNRKRPINQNLASMEKVFKRYNPAYPFEYSFTDQEYAAKFADELQIGKLAFLFAGLTLFISCVGLFGLAAYMAQRRIKEIGVRKILGATVFQITAILSLDFIKWVALALLIASPIAWWAMHNWLNAYYYRIQIQWWVFALAGILSMVIASLTVAFESIKTANANPVKSLRSE
jgi:ABC-type antimicrobial peptide transport system permease subunit